MRKQCDPVQKDNSNFIIECTFSIIKNNFASILRKQHISEIRLLNWPIYSYNRKCILKKEIKGKPAIWCLAPNRHQIASSKSSNRQFTVLDGASFLSDRAVRPHRTWYRIRCGDRFAGQHQGFVSCEHKRQNHDHQAGSD